jgi:DNA-3-methyladenine glycosylase
LKTELSRILKLNSQAAAPLLLGWILCRRLPAGTVKLKIVETEAYHQNDPASHSYRGLTKRTAPMFETGGRIYIYFSYGMHHAINLVVGPKGSGQAVLLRAAEPLEGIEIIRANRGFSDDKNLSNGPGKLAQALAIKDTLLSGQKLSKNSLWLEPPTKPLVANEVIVSTRIGITKAVEQPLRFYIKDNHFVSRV